MASIHREIEIETTAHQAWEALRDVGALHTRLVPGFVVETQLEPGARIVTFGSGRVVREWILGVDEDQRRVAWSVKDEPFFHHNASAQVFEAGADRCRFVWVADVLPDPLGGFVTGLIEQGLAVIKTTLEKTARQDGARAAGSAGSAAERAA
jgi:hypothetical protein